MSLDNKDADVLSQFMHFVISCRIGLIHSVPIYKAFAAFGLVVSMLLFESVSLRWQMAYGSFILLTAEGASTVNNRGAVHHQVI